MKVLVACDSYKGCMSSRVVSHCIEEAIHRLDNTIEVNSFLIGDGGEGTVDAFEVACGGKRVYVDTTDAYGKKINTYYVLIDNGKTAVIEVANIIGLSMCPKEKRTPYFGSSYGVGNVILDAYKKGCQKIIVGLGGSATNDGGMGLLQALGCRFYDAQHKYLSPQAINLEKIAYIDFNRFQKLENVELIAACDVKNHLLGEHGATYVFGKQKGLYPNQIKKLDKGMENYRNHMKRYLKVDINQFEGGGAAGGIGAVLIGILKAKMIPGIDLLLSYAKLEDVLKTTDLVITGEGQTDRQTKFGKVPMGVLKLANKYNIPTICISGALGLGYEELYDEGFVGLFSIADRAMTFQQALEQAQEKLKASTYTIMKTILFFKNEAFNQRKEKGGFYCKRPQKNPHV